MEFTKGCRHLSRQRAAIATRIFFRAILPLDSFAEPHPRENVKVCVNY
jgi:hypothetical protein